MKTEIVSVIVPAYNESAVIARLLKSVKNQSYAPVEIVVIDDASNDNTVQIAKKFTDKVYERLHAERSVQRNFGARKSAGYYYLFLDADMELTRNVISDCVNAVNHNRKLGAVIIPEESVATNYWEKVKAFERSFYNESGDIDTDAARFFTRESFLKAGGYDESITGPEDWDLPDTVKKMGFGEARIKSKIYHYERIKNPLKVAKKKFYYALKSHRYLKKQNISALSPKTVYFLRPVFYKNWKKLITNPILTLGMIFTLTLELIFGGAGFFLGKFLNK